MVRVRVKPVATYFPELQATAVVLYMYLHKTHALSRRFIYILKTKNAKKNVRQSRKKRKMCSESRW